MNKINNAEHSIETNLNADELIANHITYCTNDSDRVSQAVEMGKFLPAIILNKGTVFAVFSCKEIELTGACVNRNEAMTDEQFEDNLAESMIDWDTVTWEEFDLTYEAIGRSLSRAKKFLEDERNEESKVGTLTLRRV